MDVSGSDPRFGSWHHAAFVPEALDTVAPSTSVATHNAVADARAALASLDSTARRLPNPSLLRRSTLRREAQSTSALEGTYAPLAEILAGNEVDPAGDAAVNEVFNYVRAADLAFDALDGGAPISSSLLVSLHRVLVRETAADTAEAGRVRRIQVVIGQQPGSRVEDSRFVPQPPGPDLDDAVRALCAWLDTRHPAIDPVVGAAMAHYQFETLHPFNDGNGRLGRLLVVLQLMRTGVLSEPTLTVSPWFEGRRADYYDRLLAVSTDAAWDDWVGFFAHGLRASAEDTEQRLDELIGVQHELTDAIRSRGSRSDARPRVIDLSLQQPIFTAQQAAAHLGFSYNHANTLIQGLVRDGHLVQVTPGTYDRRFAQPRVLAVLTRS